MSRIATGVRQAPTPPSITTCYRATPWPALPSTARWTVTTESGDRQPSVATLPHRNLTHSATSRRQMPGIAFDTVAMKRWTSRTPARCSLCRTSSTPTSGGDAAGARHTCSHSFVELNSSSQSSSGTASIAVSRMNSIREAMGLSEIESVRVQLPGEYRASMDKA